MDKKNDSNKDNKPKKIVLYIGDDLPYWNSISDRYKTGYPQFELQTIHDKAGDYQKIFIHVLEIRPVIIYVDITKDIEFNMRLAQYLARDNSTSTIPLIGLIDKKEAIKDCIAIGLDFIHVKCAEYHDVVFDPIRVAYPKEVVLPKFAKAKLAVDGILIEDFRVGYISGTGMHAEGNCQLEEGQEVQLDHQLPRSLIPSNHFMVRKVSSTNLYYDYQYSYDLDFKFVDPPKTEESSANVNSNEDASLKSLKVQDLEKKQLLANYENELRQVKNKMKQWVRTNSQQQDQKKTKILIVDKDLSVIKNSTRPLDQYPYAIRCQSKLQDDMNELDKIRPNLIVFQIEEFHESQTEGLKEEEIQLLKEKESSSLTILSNIIQATRALDKYNPFIVIFNCTKFTSKAFQDSYKYPLLLTNKDFISLDVVLNLATMYDEKQEAKTKQLVMSKIAALKKENPSKYSRLTAADFQDPRYYLSKKNPLSFISISHLIKITSLSETDMTFDTERLLNTGVYRLNFPTPMSVTIVADKDTGKLFVENKGIKSYQALIHSVGENDKKKVRQYINEIFFGPLMAKKEKESQEVAKITESGLKKKMAEQGIDVDAVNTAGSENAEQDSSKDNKK